MGLNFRVRKLSPDFGAFFSLLANAVVPRLSFWFDPAAPSPWIAHRMPLYADGPVVFVVRQGIETNTRSHSEHGS